MTPEGDAIATEGCRDSLFPRRWRVLLLSLVRRHRACSPPMNSERLRSRPSASNGARLSINSGPKSAPSRRSLSAFTFSGQRRLAGIRSAFDAGAGATERRDLADLHRHRAQSGAGAAAVRHRGISRRPAERRAGQPVGVALSGRLPPRRPVRRRTCRLRRGVFAGARRRRRHAAADLCQTGRSADHRLDPDLRHQRSPRRQGRAGQGAGGAISRPAPLHPRRLCALCLHALRRSLCGVDPVPRQRAARAGGWPAARPIRSPSVSSKRCASPAACLSRPRTDIAAEIAERPAERSADFTYRPSGDIIANSGYRKQGGRADFTAYSQIRFPLEKAPAFAHSQSFGKRKSAQADDDRRQQYQLSLAG